MWSFIHKAGSPKTTYRWATKVQPWCMALCILLLAYGVIDGLLYAPSDFQQGNVYRIIYIHVPSAIWSLGVYTAMTSAVIVHFIWKIKVADIVAKVSAPLGALFTVLALITGSIWGKPTWGTYWVWDARLTSELILLFIYIGIIAIRSAIPDMKLAAKASGILTLVGFVNIPIVHFSVDWWHTLHQGASLSFTNSSIAPSMLHPLLATIVGFFFYYCWMVLLKVRAELLLREKATAWVRELRVN